MTLKITRLDAATLSKVFDRVTVDALLNIARIVGTESDGPSIPDINDKTDEIFVIIGTIRGELEDIGEDIESLQSVPPDVENDMSAYLAPLLVPRQEQVESVQTLSTEVRQLAEALAQVRDHFTTEVRQIADQQIVNANLIQEIRQGTML